MGPPQLLQPHHAPGGPTKHAHGQYYLSRGDCCVPLPTAEGQTRRQTARAKLVACAPLSTPDLFGLVLPIQASLQRGFHHSEHSRKRSMLDPHRSCG